MKRLLQLLLVSSATFGLTLATSGYAADTPTYSALSKQAQADYKTAKQQCDSMSGNAKSVCIADAKVTLARAKSDAMTQVNGSNRQRANALVNVADATYNAAKARCADQRGIDRDTCLAQAKATHTTDVASAKTLKGPSLGTEVHDAMHSVASATSDATSSSGVVVADSVITSKVKTDLIAEPSLKSSGVHVETMKGVVMLSGFVNTQEDADKAVAVARNVKGVSDVRSTLQVK